MKTFTLTLLLLFAFSINIAAQSEKLSKNTSQLFNDVPCKLTNAEKNDIAKLSGLQYDSQSNNWYNTTEKTPVTVNVFVFDLTKDGKEEIGISYKLNSTVNKNDMRSLLFVRDKSDNFILNIDTEGKLYFLNINNLVFPDVYVRNNAIGLPVYRWNGNNYIKHKPLNPAKLKKYTVADMSQASKLSKVATVSE